MKRESSALACMACTDTQSSYDPNFIKSIIPGETYLDIPLQQLLDVTPDEFATEAAKRKFADGSALTHVLPCAFALGSLCSRLSEMNRAW